MGKDLKKESMKRKRILIFFILSILVIAIASSLYETYTMMVDKKRAEYKRTQEVDIQNKDRSILDIDQYTAISNKFDEQERNFNQKIEEKSQLLQQQQEDIKKNAELFEKMKEDILSAKRVLLETQEKVDNKVNKAISDVKRSVNKVNRKVQKIQKDKDLENSLDIKLPKLKGVLADELNLDNEEIKRLENLTDSKSSSKKVKNESGARKKELKEEIISPIIVPEPKAVFYNSKVILKKLPKKKEDKKAEDENLEMDLMMGTVNATLLMGVDAPTSIGTNNDAAKDPLPVLLNVTSEALIANGFTQDYQDCLVLATATGNATTERAYLRLSKISCVADNGKYRIESEINGWVIGEDNKSGLSGRLVTKNGALILKALGAGILQSVADISNDSPFVVAGNDTTASSKSGGVSANSFANSVASGAGSGFQTIANYYLEMAKGMYPIVEVKGGRKVQIFIKGSGKKMKIKKVPYNRLFVGSEYELMANNNGISIDY